MRIGVPKEIKNHEYRVGLTPDSVHEMVAHGHEVVVETNAGAGIGASDADYEAAGAKILPGARDVFDAAQMIVKVKEPQAAERAMLRPDHILFTYLHLAPDAAQTADLVKSGATCIAYETVVDARGGLPLLVPMSQVAGRLSVTAGATALEKAHGGSGILIGGVPGVEPAKVVVIGGGVVGSHAITMAIGLGADVRVLDRNTAVLGNLAQIFGPALTTIYSTKAALEAQVLAADLVIGAVLVAGAAAPKLVSADLVRRMKPGSVLVDVAIDQGGCFETSKATTHSDPTYIVDEVVHYCVANMPGAVPKTSTHALNNATLPFALALADKGAKKALLDDPHFLPGLNVYQGQVTCEAVASALGYDYLAPETALARDKTTRAA
ncbi:alanine dehydrogenase [Roseibium marinum]|uniref:Alanine dehydrogenase n=1 Tax=Roseibium marinum TaxID=281252 RepID=A0A2S3UM27_9HYPH|nr:alanine dehydrogenase [Roseibium marinum]POF28620.1 alanine dehydrogenase [Roseibium marinum]